MKANIDAYLNQTLEFTIFGEEVRVNQPSVGIVKRIIRIAGDITADTFEDIIELVVEALNNNVSGHSFTREKIETLSMPALTAVVQAISGQIVEAENHPNS